MENVEFFHVTMMCRLLEVSKAGFYACPPFQFWLRPPNRT